MGKKEIKKIHQTNYILLIKKKQRKKKETPL